MRPAKKQWVKVFNNSLKRLWRMHEMLLPETPRLQRYARVGLNRLFGGWMETANRPELLFAGSLFGDASKMVRVRAREHPGQRDGGDFLGIYEVVYTSKKAKEITRVENLICVVFYDMVYGTANMGLSETTALQQLGSHPQEFFKRAEAVCVKCVGCGRRIRYTNRLGMGEHCYRKLQTVLHYAL